jgi:NhaP-type Na+/H+ or K+/H+ antiporter
LALVFYQIKQALRKLFHPLPAGALIGLAFGVAVRRLLWLMRYLGAGEEQQIALTFATAYLVFWVANAPAGVSGAPSVRDASPRQTL